jgi:hypothetical protein
MESNFRVYLCILFLFVFCKMFNFLSASFGLLCCPQMFVCNSINLTIVLYILSASYTIVHYIFFFTYRCFSSWLNLQLMAAFEAFLICTCMLLKCPPASHLALFRLSTLLWFGSCNRYIWACFLWSTNSEHSSSNHGLCCFCSYRPRPSLAEILIISLNVFPRLCYVHAIT